MGLLPLWVTGLLSIGWLIAFPADCFGALAGAVVAACVGDLLIVLKLRTLSDAVLVRDCRWELGCDVFAAKPIIAGQA
jgi:hypothetical protein